MSVKKAVCIMSGGMDSTLAAYMMRDEGYELIALHFNYAQRTQKKELESFHKICKALDIKEPYIVNLDFFSQLGDSALTDKSIKIPTRGIEEGVPVTYVPFRNGIFISLATAIAEKEGAEALIIGVVEEDSSGYPDCTQEYISSMQGSINLGTKQDTILEIKMPLVHFKKSEIVKEAFKRKVPLELTWSCYQSQEKACGLCDSCRLRLNGFKLAGEIDPIPYV